MKVNKPSPWVLAALAAVVLASPVLIYISHFSLTISNDHERWGEMGSAMGGIYAPIVGFLTLWVLWQQHKTLKAQNAIQLTQQNFLHEQHLHASTERRLHMAIVKITELLNTEKGRELHSTYEKLSTLELYNQYIADGESLDSNAIDIAGLWSAVYSCFQHFRKYDDKLSKLHFSSQRQIIFLELGYRTCMILDRIALTQKAPIETFEFDVLSNHIKETAERSSGGGEAS